LTGLGAINCGVLPGELWRKEIELARVVIGLGHNRLIVATYLGVVGILELEREAQQDVGDVSGGFVGEGELVLLLGVGLVTLAQQFEAKLLDFAQAR